MSKGSVPLAGRGTNQNRELYGRQGPEVYPEAVCHREEDQGRGVEEGKLSIDNMAETAFVPLWLAGRTGCSPALRRMPRPVRCCTGLIETAKADNLEPWAFLQNIFEHLPLAATQGDYGALLPWNVTRELLVLPAEGVGAS